MKGWLLWLVLAAGPVRAQRPTAEAVRAAVSFWPLDARTGTVAFTAPTARPAASALWQAEHVRSWLTQTCGTAWSELQASADSTHLYQGQLRGVHAGVGLRFAVRLPRPPTGWQYRLSACEVRSPTGADVAHWLPLHRLLDDVDFRSDVLSFQQQLQQALVGL